MSYTRDLKSSFEENQLMIDARLFKRIEFVIYALYSVIGEFEMASTNLYFTKFYKRFFSDCHNNDEYIFYVLRKYYHQYYSKKQFEIDFKEYMEVPEKFRLFDVVDGILVRNKKVSYLTDRSLEYNKMLSNYIEPAEKEIKFVQGQGIYERIIRTGQGFDEKYLTKSFEFDIGTRNVEATATLPSYHEKCEITLPLDFDWDSFKSKLGPRWAERPTIKLNSCGDFDNVLKYKGLVHIVGLLGAGKSTYIMQETLRLLEESKARIGIVVPNVAEVLKTYESLEKLGFKAAPIIGTTQLAKHLQHFMNSKLTSANSFNEVIKDEMKALDYLSGLCILSHFANDSDINESQYPCSSLKKEGEKDYYNCPLFNECGYFQKYINLKDSDVWITTSHSLLTSRANQIIDSQRRTYYELFHDCLDVIFVDEADSVQEVFDNQFMTDEIFYGGSESIMRKFQRVEELLKSHRAANFESEAHRWIVNQPHLTQLLNRIEYLITNTVAYRRFLIQDTLTPRSLFFSLLGDIADPESPQSQRFIRSIESFLPLSEELKLNEELMSHELFVLYDKFTKCPNMGNAAMLIEEIIERYINEYDLKVKTSKMYNRKKLFNKKLELFIYIVLVDYYFRIQNSTIENLAVKLPEINTIFTPFKFYNKEFIHFLTESVIGNIFGYKFILDDNNLFKVHLFNYSGIGRSLIEEWPYAKKEIGRKGPAVVLLSGTSYAPASAHFHIDEEPTFFLKSEKQEGTINQFINVKHDKKGEVIRISGVSDRVLKQEKLIELTNNLLNDFKVEINYWREQGVNRRVLVIVNSYEQCRAIGDYLLGRNITYKILSNSENLKDDEFTASQIEAIPFLGNIDVVVAPLSIISRGYNIIDDTGDSYFGSAFFLIRPYISPEDLTYNYRILNSIIAPMIRENQAKGHNITETMSIIRKFAFEMMDEFNENKFWKNLSVKQREILSWYTYIPIKQAVGRMQRNGCHCRVFYCDGSFLNCQTDRELNSNESMLKAWQEILENVESDIGKMLYGNYLSGLSEAISNYEKIFVKEYYEEELY